MGTEAWCDLETYFDPISEALAKALVVRYLAGGAIPASVLANPRMQREMRRRLAWAMLPRTKARLVAALLAV